MRNPLPSLLGAGLLAAAVSSFAAVVSVVFVQPEDYADASYSHAVANDRDRLQVQRDIERHFQRLGERYLEPGESLKVEILDIDLAGRFEPFRFHDGSEPRIVRDITWPRMKLRYSLARGDQIVASGEERISDMNFLMSGNRYSSSDPLRYEKAMLDNWFQTRIASHHGGWRLTRQEACARIANGLHDAKGIIQRSGLALESRCQTWKIRCGRCRRRD